MGRIPECFGSRASNTDESVHAHGSVREQMVSATPTQLHHHTGTDGLENKESFAVRINARINNANDLPPVLSGARGGTQRK